MKKQDITYQDKYDELVMDISHPNNKDRIFILVEGESDVRLFRKLFDSKNCKVESIPGGNVKLEECTDNLSQKYSLVFGVRDSDFIQLGTDTYSKNNMFLTDFHDIEMTLISTDDIFSSIASEYTNIPPEQHSNIRSDIIRSIDYISYLKWLNENKNLEIKFEAGFQDLIAFADLNVNFQEYWKRLLVKSPNAKITEFSIVLTEIDKLKTPSPNPFHLCNGHDFMKALSAFLNSRGNSKGISEAMLSSAFRIAFTKELWEKTLLYSNTKKWADSNNCLIY